VIFTVREALKEMGIRPEDTLASVQGFGNVANTPSNSTTTGRHVILSLLDQEDHGPILSSGKKVLISKNCRPSPINSRY